jgi:guanylate kinase
MSSDGARRGLMLVLSSPSGAGKSTLSRMLVERDAAITLSVSATTRPPRPGEQDGREYRFMGRADFEAMAGRGEFLEWALVFDNFYGTPRAPVEAALAAGRDVLFDVDWQGARALRAAAPLDVVGVFILPPSHAELERRPPPPLPPSPPPAGPPPPERSRIGRNTITCSSTATWRRPMQRSSPSSPRSG